MPCLKIISTVPKIWHAVPIFLTRVNGVLLTGSEKYHLGVINGPLKFLTARKILPLLDLLAKFK